VIFLRSIFILPFGQKYEIRISKNET